MVLNLVNLILQLFIELQTVCFVFKIKLKEITHITFGSLRMPPIELYCIKLTLYSYKKNV